MTTSAPLRSDRTATGTVLVAGAAVVVHVLALVSGALGLVVALAGVDGWHVHVTTSDLTLAAVVAVLRLVLTGVAVGALVVAARGRGRSGDGRVRVALAVSVVVLLLGVLPIGAFLP